jgi:hypothetical protein
MSERPGYALEKQVAETATGPNSTEIAGVVRGCVKTVVSAGTTTTQQANKDDPIYTKVGYILGLRVSPSHRYVLVVLSSHCVLYIYTILRGCMVAIDQCCAPI